MLHALLPLVSVALAAGSSAPAAEPVVAAVEPVRAAAELVTSPRVAQVRLAETLSEATSIEAVSARGRRVTFAIIHDGAALDVTATVTKSGEVVALAITPARAIAAQLHGLTWLADELAQATAVTRLVVDEDGAVLIRTSEGQRYMAIPGRGSGGANAAAEARWAAAWTGAGA